MKQFDHKSYNMEQLKINTLQLCHCEMNYLQLATHLN